MSDGPHKSLRMRRPWRRVAECADNRSSTSDEIRERVVLAVEHDCRAEVRPEFVAQLRGVVEEPSLFKESTVIRIGELRPVASPGLERSFLDCLEHLSAADQTGLATLQDALTTALQNNVNRRARQVEEHYLRESTLPRASNLRERLDSVIGISDLADIATRFLSVHSKSAAGDPLKKTGLDDGVKIR